MGYKGVSSIISHPHAILPRTPVNLPLKENADCNHTMTKPHRIGIRYSYKTITLLKLIYLSVFLSSIPNRKWSTHKEATVHMQYTLLKLVMQTRISRNDSEVLKGMYTYKFKPQIGYLPQERPQAPWKGRGKEKILSCTARMETGTGVSTWWKQVADR